MGCMLAASLAAAALCARSLVVKPMGKLQLPVVTQVLLTLHVIVDLDWLLQ